MASGGVGIVFKSNQAGQLCVVDLIPGSPAHQCSRIHHNDIVAKVDGIDVTGWDIPFVQSLILGPVGTAVVLGLDRGGPVLTYVRIERAASSSSLPDDSHETILLLDSGGGSAIVRIVVAHLGLDQSVKLVSAADTGLTPPQAAACGLGLWPILLRGATKVSGPAAVARLLAAGTVLLGATPLEDALIAQWCSYRNAILTSLPPASQPPTAPPAAAGGQPAAAAPRRDNERAPEAESRAAAAVWEQALGRLDGHLQTRTYAVGGRLTLADLALFALAEPAVRRAAAAAAPAAPAAQGEPAGLRARVPHLARWFDHVQHVPAVRRVFPSAVGIDTSFDVPLPFRPAAAGRG